MSKSKKILVICAYPQSVAPSQRLKYEQYFDHFKKNQIEVTVSPFMTIKFWNIVYKPGNLFLKLFWTFWGYFRRTLDLFRISFYDGVYISLWATPFGPPIFESLICMLNRNVIYDIDDMIFLGHASKANKFIAPLKGPYKMIYLMKKAKHVIVCTPKLEVFVRKYNQNVTDISSTINTEVYKPNNSYTNERPLTLGWSGSHSTSKYFHLLEDVLYTLSKEFDFNVLVIGDASFKFKKLDVEAIPWCETSEVSDLQRIDIGLYPLLDEEWVYGKSGLKALQYMALGIPTIATAIGANYRVIENGHSGYLVKSDQEWIEKLRFLIKNPLERKRIGIKARERVENIYSVKANQGIYLQVLSEVIQ